jgi:uncharacterized protein YxjI
MNEKRKASGGITMALCIKEHVFSWNGIYDVYDEKENILYTVKGEFWSLGHKIHIYDGKGEEVAYIHEKVWAFFKTFEIYLHGEKKGVLKEKFSWFRPKYQVDFLNCEIEGDIFEWNYEMRRGAETIAMVQRKIFSWANVFYLSYPDPKDELAVLTLAIAIDAAHHDNENAEMAYIVGSNS